MIHTDFSWSSPLNLTLLLAALALLVLQCTLLYARHRQSGRLGIRLILNVLVWMSVLAWILDPYFKYNARARVGLLIAANVPAETAARMRDSLARAELVTPDELENRPPDTLIIVGQEFDEALFATVRQLKNSPKLQWKPYFATGELRELHWHGILKKGEMQLVEGSIHQAKKGQLRLRYAGIGDVRRSKSGQNTAGSRGITLDSAVLNAGENRFRLTFPTFSEGRTTVTLDLDGTAPDTVRFFTQPDPKLTVRFVVDNPDFETRNLATWLGKQGHAVLYDAGLSKNIRRELNINRAAEPDLIVTSASNAGNPVVKKAVNAGQSVLFMQLTDVAAELRVINRALGTRFQAAKISNDESVPISPALTALPFRFESLNYQMHAPHYPVATEKVAGKVAVSLLNETFPLQLSGDSVAYGRVWREILAYARPAQAAVTTYDAPVFEKVPATLHLHNFQPVPRFLRFGNDTVSTVTSAFNERAATADFLPVQNGWLPLHDSLGTELYVQHQSRLGVTTRMQHFIQSTDHMQSIQKLHPSDSTTDLAATRKVPGWAWFTWLLLCLTALWIEPKI